MASDELRTAYPIDRFSNPNSAFRSILTSGTNFAPKEANESQKQEHVSEAGSWQLQNSIRLSERYQFDDQITIFVAATS